MGKHKLKKMRPSSLAQLLTLFIIIQISICSSTIYGISDDVEERAFALLRKSSEQGVSKFNENLLMAGNKIRLLYFTTEDIDGNGKAVYDDDYKKTEYKNGILYKMNFVQLSEEEPRKLYHGVVMFENTSQNENNLTLVKYKSFDWHGAVCRYIDDWTCHHYRHNGSW